MQKCYFRKRAWDGNQLEEKYSVGRTVVPWDSQEISVELLPRFKPGSCLPTEQNFAKEGWFCCLGFLRKQIRVIARPLPPASPATEASVNPNPVCYTA